MQRSGSRVSRTYSALPAVGAALLASLFISMPRVSGADERPLTTAAAVQTPSPTTMLSYGNPILFVLSTSSDAPTNARFEVGVSGGLNYFINNAPSTGDPKSTQRAKDLAKDFQNGKPLWILSAPFAKLDDFATMCSMIRPQDVDPMAALVLLNPNMSSYANSYFLVSTSRTSVSADAMLVNCDPAGKVRVVWVDNGVEGKSNASNVLQLAGPIAVASSVYTFFGSKTTATQTTYPTPAPAPTGKYTSQTTVTTNANFQNAYAGIALAAASGLNTANAGLNFNFNTGSTGEQALTQSLRALAFNLMTDYGKAAPAPAQSASPAASPQPCATGNSRCSFLQNLLQATEIDK